MFHPILKEGLMASALCAEVLVLAARIFLTKFTGTTCEYLEAKNAMVHLVCQRQEPRVIHVWVFRCDMIEAAALHELPL
eukprot:CAMPEP_0172923510 /NCGR_PEP_ID=MMETSP1075-20121228/209868_1 /TAXON_ID=2916 /ORGANISM="Ceratium fusus, Strain PA161109" /LENGTH=78 /DNA_ID=CAMNT_0013784003 /DNA_START=91 /DNA_END=323 /DNA_ORIENTATION=+